MNFKHGKRRHPLYITWTNIKTRCSNVKVASYKYYGGRGITICGEWANSFESFFNFAMENGWQPGLEIDRINVNGDYSPRNCRFVTSEINSRNRRMRSDNNTGYVGVGWNKKRRKYISRITVNKRLVAIGAFDSAEDAFAARNLYIKNNNLSFNQPHI